MDFFDELLQEADRILADNNGGKKNNSAYTDKFVQIPDEGAITLRLLPPSHGLRLPFVTTRLHKLKNGATARSYHCRKQLEGGKWVGKPGVCSPCDHYNHLWSEINAIVGNAPGAARKSTNPKVVEMLEIADRIKPIERFYYNCVVRDDPSQKKTKVLSIGKMIQKDLMLAFVGNKKVAAIKPMGNICDVTGVTGRDIIIIKEKKKGGNFPEYKIQFCDPSPLGTPDEIKEFLAGCYNLAELRTLKDAAEMKKLLQIDLGLIAAEEDTGYNPNDFMKPVAVSAKPAQAVRVEAPAPRPAAETVVEEPPFDVSEEEVLPDEDFLAELNDV